MSYHEMMADREEAWVLGQMDPDRAWVLTDRDVWHRNPFYQGPPVGHPEDDYDDDEIERELDRVEHNGPTFWVRYVDDEIPF